MRYDLPESSAWVVASFENAVLSHIRSGRHFVILQFMTAQLADAAGGGRIVEVSCCSCSHVDIERV